MTRQRDYALAHIDFEGAPPRFRKHRSLNKKDEKVPTVNSTIFDLEREPLHPFLAWVLDSSGLSADAYRVAPLHRRIKACLRALKAESVSAAWGLMQSPESMEKILDSLLIGVTEFFRDKPVFDELQKIIASSMAFQPKPLRVLSAGCSNGAELYSLAMLLAEAGLNDQSIMVGADCRADAIRKAQAGIYSSASLQSMESALLQKYFRSSGAHYQIVDYLRQNAQWRVSNLLSGVEKGPWDIILWRNMAIYLNPEFATQIWTALIKELRPGGYLVVGRAEQPPSSLGLIFKSRCIYQLLSQAILGS